jgi:hypothetical protein
MILSGQAKALRVSRSILWATSPMAGHASPTEFPEIKWNHGRGGAICAVIIRRSSRAEDKLTIPSDVLSACVLRETETGSA